MDAPPNSFAEPPPGRDPSAAEASQWLIEYLAARHPDHRRAARAVAVLAERDPQRLVRVWRGLQAVPDPDEAEPVEELSAYLALGDDGPRRMPETHALVTGNAELADLATELSQASARWHAGLSALSAEIRRQAAEPAPQWLALFKSGWRLVRGAPGAVARGAALLEVAARLGDWLLQPAAGQPALARLNQSAVPAVTLSLDLPGGAARLDLTVTPRHLPTEQRDVWQLVFCLHESSRLPRVFVALGDERSEHTAQLTLTRERSAEFQEPPPAPGQVWRVYCEWHDGQQLQTKAFVLPVGTAGVEEQS